jgi:hypothetical protein
MKDWAWCAPCSFVWLLSAGVSSASSMVIQPRGQFCQQPRWASLLPSSFKVEKGHNPDRFPPVCPAALSVSRHHRRQCLPKGTVSGLRPGDQPRCEKTALVSATCLPSKSSIPTGLETWMTSLALLDFPRLLLVNPSPAEMEATLKSADTAR